MLFRNPASMITSKPSTRFFANLLFRLRSITLDGIKSVFSKAFNVLLLVMSFSARAIFLDFEKHWRLSWTWSLFRFDMLKCIAWLWNVLMLFAAYMDVLNLLLWQILGMFLFNISDLWKLFKFFCALIVFLCPWLISKDLSKSQTFYQFCLDW